MVRAVGPLARVEAATAAAAKLVVLLLAGAAGTMFVTLWLVRLRYPLELGNIEGVMMDHVARLAAGKPIYVAPSLEFIPLAYMPFYTAVVSLLARMFGPAFWEGRLIGGLATLAVAGWTFVLIRERTRSALHAMAGAGLFLMGFAFTSGSYDLVRPDALMLALVWTALWMLGRFRNPRSAVIAAALMALAVFTKQHAVCFAVAAIGYLAFADRRRLVPYVVALVAFGAGGFLLLSLWLGPWFRFYVLDVPSHWSQWHMGRVLEFTGVRLFGTLAPLSVPAVLAWTLPFQRRSHDSLPWWIGLGGAGSGLLATLDPYAYHHVLMPTLAAMCVLGPIAIHRLSAAFQSLESREAERVGGATPAPGPWPELAGAGLLAVQLVVLLYSPRLLWPPRSGAQAAASFVARLHDEPGRVMVPSHGFLTWRAGKGTSLHVMPLDDILRARGNSLLARDPGALERLFDALRAGSDRPVLVMDAPLDRSGDVSRPLWSSLSAAYHADGDLGALSDQLRPVSGVREAPRWIYRPGESASGAAAAH